LPRKWERGMLLGELKSRVGDFFSRLRGELGERELENILWDFQISLMEADVALEIAEDIVDDLRESFMKNKSRDVVKERFKEKLEEILNKAKPERGLLELISEGDKPYVILFLGVNGTGKTTTIAKVAHYLSREGLDVVIAAGDTFRAGAIEQIEEHARRLGVKLVKHDVGADSAAVAYDAIKHAEARGKDIVLIDTAGRMQTNRNLMDELRKIARVSKPDMKVFVGDALSGNDVVDQATTFDREIGVDSIILAKMDAAKGGCAISLAYVLEKPILFLGTGQKYEDLMEFDPQLLIDLIIGD